MLGMKSQEVGRDWVESDRIDLIQDCEAKLAIVVNTTGDGRTYVKPERLW